PEKNQIDRYLNLCYYLCLLSLHSALFKRCKVSLNKEIVMQPYDCSICFEDTRQLSYLYGHTGASNVKHLFHHECILQWIRSDARCPMCMQNLNIHQLMSLPNPNYQW